jgi:ribosome-binding protein aMBF1 (putative translation factor)
MTTGLTSAIQIIPEGEVCPKCDDPNFPSPAMRLDPDGESMVCPRCHYRVYRPADELTITDDQLGRKAEADMTEKLRAYHKRKSDYREDRLRVGKILWRARDRLRLSVSQMADRCGCSASSVYHYENGKERPFKTSVIQRIAKSYQVDVNDLWRVKAVAPNEHK